MGKPGWESNPARILISGSFFKPWLDIVVRDRKDGDTDGGVACDSISHDTLLHRTTGYTHIALLMFTMETEYVPHSACEKLKLTDSTGAFWLAYNTIISLVIQSWHCNRGDWPNSRIAQMKTMIACWQCDHYTSTWKVLLLSGFAGKASRKNMSENRVSCASQFMTDLFIIPCWHVYNKYYAT